MTPRVIQVTHIRDFVLRIRFSDGREGDIDLGGELDGEIFAPFESLAISKKYPYIPNCIRSYGLMVLISRRSSCTTS